MRQEGGTGGETEGNTEGKTEGETKRTFLHVSIEVSKVLNLHMTRVLSAN